MRKFTAIALASAAAAGSVLLSTTAAQAHPTSREVTRQTFYGGSGNSSNQALERARDAMHRYETHHNAYCQETSYDTNLSGTMVTLHAICYALD